MNTREEADIKAIADEVFSRYRRRYGDDVNGCCLVIADELCKRIDGVVVAGMLTWNGGSCQRAHWWIEKDGLTVDPMGDWLLASEEHTGRTEVHRDRAEFDAILPDYEKWRVTGLSFLL